MDFLRWVVASVLAFVGGVLGFGAPQMSTEQQIPEQVVVEQQVETTSSVGQKSIQLKPIADSEAFVGNILTLTVDRGSKVTMSWNVTNASNCSVHVMRNQNSPDSYDNWGANIALHDSRVTDPINYDQKYRLICTQEGNVLVSTLDLKVRKASKVPTCSVVAEPKTVEEGQLVTYTISATDVAKFGYGVFPPESVGNITFPLKLPLKARIGETKQTFTVQNEAGSATCSATITITGQSNSQGLQISVEKIPTFVWSESHPNIPLTYTVSASSQNVNLSDYSLCASMRDSANAKVSEEDCSPIQRLGRVEIKGDLSLAPDRINHKEFWDTAGVKKLKVLLRVVKGTYSADGSNLQSSVAEDDTGYFTLSL